MNKNNYFVIFLKKINLSVNSLIKKYLNKLKTSNKNNYFVIFVKKINLSVNSLIKKYSKKLNISNLSNILLNNKVFLTFIGLIVLFFLYLLIPHTYSKTEIRKELENQLLNKYNLDFNFSKNFNYKFFPRPHFIINDSSIIEDEVEISDIKKLKVYISLENLFSLKNIIVKNVILENTNFNLNKRSSNFFIKLLDNNFLDSSFTVENSNVFFRNTKNEVLFINKIIKMRYYYDPKELKNIIKSKNEIFNIPYAFNSYKDSDKNKISSQISSKFIKLKIENELNYIEDLKKGFIKIIFNKNNFKANYKFNKNYFSFKLFDRLNNPNFTYKGKIDFTPFHSNLEGKAYKINMSNLLEPNSLFIQLLKTEIFNNKHLNVESNINIKNYLRYESFNNILLNFKIREGLIDIDNTKFSWNDLADFKILDSLIYLNKNQLILDGKLVISVKNYDKIYKFLQISKKLRPVINNIELNFNYNFDQQIANFNDIKINNQTTQNIKVLKNITLKRNKLQNQIYFKKILKKAIAAYAG